MGGNKIDKGEALIASQAGGLEDAEEIGVRDDRAGSGPWG